MTAAGASIFIKQHSYRSFYSIFFFVALLSLFDLLRMVTLNVIEGYHSANTHTLWKKKKLEKPKLHFRMGRLRRTRAKKSELPVIEKERKRERETIRPQTRRMRRKKSKLLFERKSNIVLVMKIICNGRELSAVVWTFRPSASELVCATTTRGLICFFLSTIFVFFLQCPAMQMIISDTWQMYVFFFLYYSVFFFFTRTVEKSTAWKWNQSPDKLSWQRDFARFAFFFSFLMAKADSRFIIPFVFVVNIISHTINGQKTVVHRRACPKASQLACRMYSSVMILPPIRSLCFFQISSYSYSHIVSCTEIPNIVRTENRNLLVTSIKFSLNFT